jgi:hypothetical protein
MTIDTWLGLIGIITGIVGVVLAYVFYKKSVRTKVLAISYTNPIPLMITLGGLEVVYEGASIRALSRVYLLFWNRGTSPIEANDFLTPIEIAADKAILNLTIHDKDAAANVRLDEHAQTLSIDLLRPGEAITLVAEVTSDKYRPDVNVQMKSSDMSTFISAIRTLYPGLVGFGCAMAIIVAEMIAGVLSFPSEPPPGFTVYSVSFLASIGLFAASIIAFFLPPLVIGAIASKIAQRFLSRATTPVAWNFFTFKQSAWTMRVKMKDFRKFMDAEYKKIAPD